MKSRDENQRLASFTKACALTGFLFLFYPVFLLINGIMKNSAAEVLIWLAAAGLAYAAGYFFRVLLTNLETYHGAAAMFLMILACPAAAGICFCLCRYIFSVPVADTVILTVFTAAAYIFGMIFKNTEYKKIITPAFFTAAQVMNVAAVLVLVLLKREFPMTLTAVILIFIAMLTAIVKNQGHIDFLMERRRHGMQFLPRKIRSYNIKLISVLCVVLTLLFLLRKYLAELLRLVLRFAGWLSSQFVRFVDWIYGLIFSSRDSSLPEIEGFEEGMQFPQAEQRSVSMLGVYIFYTLVGILLIVLIYRKRKKISASVARFAGSIINFLRRFFSDKPKKVSGAGSLSYVDIEEFLDRESLSAINHLSEKHIYKSAVREWKRKISGYRRMDSGVMKFRTGYRLVHEGYRLMRKPVENFHTPNEVAKIVRQPDFNPVADTYNQVRYGETGDGVNGIKDIDRILAKIFKTI